MPPIILLPQVLSRFLESSDACKRSDTLPSFELNWTELALPQRDDLRPAELAEETGDASAICRTQGGACAPVRATEPLHNGIVIVQCPYRRTNSTPQYNSVSPSSQNTTQGKTGRAHNKLFLHHSSDATSPPVTKTALERSGSARILSPLHFTDF